MDTQSKFDHATAVGEQMVSHWTDRATEARAMASESRFHHDRAILEHIAKLYDSLAILHRTT